MPDHPQCWASRFIDTCAQSPGELTRTRWTLPTALLLCRTNDYYLRKRARYFFKLFFGECVVERKNNRIFHCDYTTGRVMLYTGKKNCDTPSRNVTPLRQTQTVSCFGCLTVGTRRWAPYGGFLCCVYADAARRHCTYPVTQSSIFIGSLYSLPLLLESIERPISQLA